MGSNYGGVVMPQKRAAWLLILVVVMVSPFAVSVTFARTWKSSGRTYSLDAEFVESKDGTVSLRKPNGDVIQVSVSRLSAEDQAYVTEQAAGNGVSSAMAAASSPSIGKLTFTQLVQSANRLRTASEVLRLYKMFLQDKNITEADRKAAEKQLPTWEERAKKQMVRIGLRWLTPAESRNKKLQARQLVAEAVRLIKIGQFDTAISKCIKASRTDEDNIQADFILGLGYALLGCDAEKASHHFAVCVRRDPRHISALNNLALGEVRLKRYSKALSHWQTALELAPAAPEVIQNIGRLLHLARQGRLHVLTGTQRRFSDLYAMAAVSADAKDFNRRIGWLYMGYYKPLGEPSVKDKDVDQPVRQLKTRLRIAGCATGFVVHPEYILTNRHVVQDKSGRLRAGLLVVPPEEKNRKLPASVVVRAEGRDNDLAVIHCKGLTAQPLPFIKDDFTKRGTEIMVFGFPGIFDWATPSLKSTRGAIAGLPDESFNRYFSDAITNPGNSGGPICDKTGSVLAIHVAATGPAALLSKNYALHIPHSHALPLINKWIPNYNQLPPNTEIKEWVDVDGLVSRSTVLIWIQSRVSNFGISPKPKVKRKGKEKDHNKPQPMEDRWCMTCYGRGTKQCPNRKCKNGIVVTKRWTVVGVDPGTGYTVTRNEPYRDPRKKCGGKGVVRCPDCHNGIDKSLR